jgi:hypothetical protein
MRLIASAAIPATTTRAAIARRPWRALGAAIAGASTAGGRAGCGNGAAAGAGRIVVDGAGVGKSSKSSVGGGGQTKRSFAVAADGARDGGDSGTGGAGETSGAGGVTSCGIGVTSSRNLVASRSRASNSRSRNAASLADGSAPSDGRSSYVRSDRRSSRLGVPARDTLSTSGTALTGAVVTTSDLPSGASGRARMSRRLALLTSTTFPPSDGCPGMLNRVTSGSSDSIGGGHSPVGKRNGRRFTARFPCKHRARAFVTSRFAKAELRRRPLLLLSTQGRRPPARRVRERGPASFLHRRRSWGGDRLPRARWPRRPRRRSGDRLPTIERRWRPVPRRC